ncbi:MAG: MFS transporter [Proteobacteria bacterium]|nr:MFS transporter [Pseudomonadota bacterium]
MTPSNTPVAPPRGIYHGWIVLAALFASGFFVYGGGLYCFTLLVEPLTVEFHWTRQATGGLVSAFWLSAPLLLFGGFAIKRFGVTRLLLAGIIVEALCVTLVATVSTFWPMYALRVVMGFGKVMWAVSIPVTISYWFSRRFGFALGVAWAGWHVGGMALAPVTAWIIETEGWRTACVSLGVALIALALGPVVWAQRIRSPAALGLGLDGDPLPAADAAPAAAASKAPVTAAGSLRTLLSSPVYWLVAVATLCFYTTYGGLFAHTAAIVEESGHSRATAGLVLSALGGCAAIGGLITGWILDRSPLLRVAVLVNGLLLAGALALMSANGTSSIGVLVIYAVCFGFTVGGSDIFFVAMLRRRFPDIGVDFVYSTWYCIQLMTLTTAPFAAGWVYDQTGDYKQTLALLAGCAAVATVLSIIAARAPGSHRR